MTPHDLQENERRLGLIDRLKDADAAAADRLLKSQSTDECAALARHADQIGQRRVGALVWDHIRRTR